VDWIYLFRIEGRGLQIGSHGEYEDVTLLGCSDM
jgi:hypothetical protein